MFKTKIYILLCAIILILSACGGGDGGGNAGGTVLNEPQGLDLKVAQQDLQRDVYSRLIQITTEFFNSGFEVPPIPSRDRGHLGYPTLISGGNYLGEYRIHKIDREYQVRNQEIPTAKWYRDSEFPELGTVRIDLETTDNEILQNYLYFDSFGNSVIWFNQKNDIIAGGNYFVGNPTSVEITGLFTYRGLNFYKETDNWTNIQRGKNFELTLDFDRGIGRFNSGLIGNVELQRATGRFEGTSIELENSHFTQLVLAGAINGNEENSSVTASYNGESNINSDHLIFGAIIGTKSD